MSTRSELQQSESNAMGTVSNIYYLIHDAVRGSRCEETTDIRFIYGDGTVTAQLETNWFGFGEGRCSAGNRACALVRAIEQHNHDEAIFHCSCEGEQRHSDYIGQSFDDILNLAECVLQSCYDEKVDPYL